MQASGLLTSLQAAVQTSATPAAREGALLAVAELCQTIGKAVEPFIVLSVLPAILERYGDKVCAHRVHSFVVLCYSSSCLLVAVAGNNSVDDLFMCLQLVSASLLGGWQAQSHRSQVPSYVSKTLMLTLHWLLPYQLMWCYADHKRAHRC